MMNQNDSGLAGVLTDRAMSKKPMDGVARAGEQMGQGQLISVNAPGERMAETPGFTPSANDHMYKMPDGSSVPYIPFANPYSMQGGLTDAAGNKVGNGWGMNTGSEGASNNVAGLGSLMEHKPMMGSGMGIMDAMMGGVKKAY